MYGTLIGQYAKKLWTEFGFQSTFSISLLGIEYVCVESALQSTNESLPSQPPTSNLSGNYNYIL